MARGKRLIGMSVFGTLSLALLVVMAAAPRSALATIGPVVEEATVEIGTTEGEAGSFVSVDVTLMTLNTEVQVAGLQHDIQFDPAAAIAADKDGQPLCEVNADINKPDTAFAFQPPGCELAAAGGAGPVLACNAVRAVVITATNVDAIASGSILYTCTVAIAADAMGVIPLVCAGSIVSDPAGNAVGFSGCLDGAVIVTAQPPPPLPTNTPAPSGPNKSCTIVAPVDSQVGWLLLVPAVALFWLRRRMH